MESGLSDIFTKHLLNLRLRVAERLLEPHWMRELDMRLPFLVLSEATLIKPY